VTEAQRLVALLLEGWSPREFLKRPEIAVRRPTKDDVHFALWHEPEDMYELEGNFTDPADVEWIRKELEDGNDWAWCRTQVHATWTDPETGKEYEGDDYLGGCSYRSKEDFMQPGGYYDDMKNAAYDELVKNVEADREAQED
jgi:hypothetical protein